MALETRVSVREYGAGVEPVDDFASLRRSYEKVIHVRRFKVGRERASLKADITDIQYVYIRQMGTEAEKVTVSMFRNLSPEAWKFNSVLLMTGMVGCQALSFSADGEAELVIYIAGK